MTIVEALEQHSTIYRQAWPKQQHLTVSSGIIYIHETNKDMKGRLYNPTFNDIIQLDWKRY
jgi:hypothetical protein